MTEEASPAARRATEYRASVAATANETLEVTKRIEAKVDESMKRIEWPGISFPEPVLLSSEPATYTSDHDDVVRLAVVRDLHRSATLMKPRTRDDKRLYKALGWKPGESVCAKCDEYWPCNTAIVIASRPTL